jgi:glycosyltransferase involved in cell wall biosynthesis
VDGEPRDGAVPDAPNVITVRASGAGFTRATAALVGRPRLDRQLGAPDLVWIPAPAPVAVSPDVPYVLTVHDLSFAHRPEDFSSYDRVWHRVARPRRLAERASRVLTDTAHVRRQLMEEWNLPAEQVRAVLLGPGSANPAQGSPPEPTKTPHVLAVGALEPRKQPLQLAWAHARARERGLRARLVFVGDGPLRPELEATGATLLGTATDAELGAAYANALCLACVSREEGFGFTPLEALAAGVPPVVSDLPVFTETLGDAALRVPAGDADALSDALLRLEAEPHLRERLVEKGRARIAELTWERAALDTRAVFGEALA